MEQLLLSIQKKGVLPAEQQEQHPHARRILHHLKDVLLFIPVTVSSP